MKESDLKQYFEIYTDIWKVFKKYSNPKSEAAFWNELCAESRKIYKKHGKTMFVRRELLNMIDEIEKIWKKGGNTDGKHK